MSAGEFAPKTVRAVFFDRDKERCFRCYRGLKWEERGMGWSAHHRKPRGMGGTSDPKIARASNCLILCGSGTTGCHGWVESHRANALELGLLVPRNGNTDPAHVAAVREDGTVWWLTDAATAVEVGEKVPF